VQRVVGRLLVAVSDLKVGIPYVGELRPLDVRMVELAEHLGVRCETLSLDRTSEHTAYLSQAVPADWSCLIVNPQVIKEWLGGSDTPSGLISFLSSRFSQVIVHGLGVDDFDTNLIAGLSGGHLHSLRAIDTENATYDVAKDSTDVCGAFAGLSFGPVSPANDRVMLSSGGGPAVRPLISIGGQLFMAAVRLEAVEVLLIASGDVVDLNADSWGSPLATYFSKFLPHAMALRRAAGAECWRPGEAHASVIIDDPLLWTDYGFLNFDSLLVLMERHNFHTTIAFIPHNFRRNSPRIISMFRENPSRLSICYHGNDHSEAEFASTDMVLLNTMLHVAEQKMAAHHRETGLACDKVMVFPQEDFSEEALTVIKSHNFYAVVNSAPHPPNPAVRPTIGEVAEPAVLRYGGVPLFTRKLPQHLQSQDIAFNVFFGRPVLVVDHHEVFKHPELVAELVDRINSVASTVHWSNLATAVSHSILTRRSANGTRQIRAYSNTVRVSNDSDSIESVSIEWVGRHRGVSVEKVLVDGESCSRFEINDGGILTSVELNPHTSRTVSLVHRYVQRAVKPLGLGRRAKVFIRRRLSEFRDNYLSKNEVLLMAIQSLKRRLPL
jgi:hypothetical protein